jgi:hypothetical protein
VEAICRLTDEHNALAKFPVSSERKRQIHEHVEGVRRANELLGDSADGLSDVTATALFVLLTSDVPALPPY